MEEENKFEYVFNKKMKKKYITFLKKQLSKNKIFTEQYDILVDLLDKKIKNKNFQSITNNILYNYLENGKKTNNEEYLSRLQIILNKHLTFNDSNEIIEKILKTNSEKEIDKIEKNIYELIKNKDKKIKKELNFECDKLSYIVSEIFKKLEYINNLLEKKNNIDITKKVLFITNDEERNVFKKYNNLVPFNKDNIYYYDINNKEGENVFKNKIKYDYVFCYFSMSKFNNIEKYLNMINLHLNENGLLIVIDNDIFNLEDYYVCEFLEKLKEPNKKFEKINPLCLLDIEFLLKDLNLYHIETRPLNNFLRQYPKSIYRFISFYIKNKK